MVLLIGKIGAVKASSTTATIGDKLSPFPATIVARA